MDILKQSRKKNLYFSIKVIILFCAIVVLLAIFIQVLSTFGYYDYLNNNHFKSRNIDTPLRLWTNGYLALFFRFDEFGYLPVLIWPCFFYILLKWKKFSNGIKALVMVFIFSAMLIGVKGFYNYRYAFTLFPFIIISIFWLSHDCVCQIYCCTHKKRNGIFWISFSTVCLFLGFLSIYSIYVHKDKYITGWKYANHHQHDRSYRFNLIKALDKLDINNQNKILVVNVNDFFYFSNLKAIMFRDLIKMKNEKNLWDKIKSENIKYILSDAYLFKSLNTSSLLNILLDDSKVVLIDKARSLKLYEVVPDLSY